MTLTDIPKLKALIDRIDAASRHVLLCPKCARLWLQCEGQSVNYWQYERVEDVT